MKRKSKEFLDRSAAIRKKLCQLIPVFRKKLGLPLAKLELYEATNNLSYAKGEVQFFTKTEYPILKVHFSTVDEGKNWHIGGQAFTSQISMLEQLLNNNDNNNDKPKRSVRQKNL